MKNFIVSLQGKKSYILATVTALLNLAVAFGWVSPAHLTEINVILASLFGVALRAGISKAI